MRSYWLKALLIFSAAIVTSSTHNVLAANSAFDSQSQGVNLPQSIIANAGSLNSVVYNYAASKIGQKVGDGECATLAVEALKAAGAKNFWQLGPTGNDADYVWGSRVATINQTNKSTANIAAGDIIQFRNVSTFKKITFPNGGWRTETASYNHHTALVERVSGTEIYLLHQNVGDSGKAPDARKIVQRGTIDLNNLTGGTMWVYRPTR